MLPAWTSLRAWLGARTVPLTLADAQLALFALRETSRMRAVYAHFFPAELAASTASWSVPKGGQYAPADLECMRLVDRRLFPLTDDWEWEIREGEFERSAWLPITSFGIEWAEPADLTPAWQILGALAGLFAPDDTLLPDAVQALLAGVPCGPAETGWLTACCAHVRAPLRQLPLALRRFEGDTDSAFLNATSEMPIDVTWKLDEVIWAADDWVRATHVLAAINPLLDALDALAEDGADLTLLRRLVRLWRKIQAPPTPLRPRTLLESLLPRVLVEAR